MDNAPTLPVIKSLIEPRALSQAISQSYALSNVRCQLMKPAMRDVYHVTSDEGDFVALIYRANCRQDSIHEEITLTDYLVAQRLPVVMAVRQTTGDYLLTLPAPEGIRHAILLPFVQGAISRNPDASIIHRYGALTAEFHQRTDEMPMPRARPVYDADLLLIHSMQVLEATLGHLQPFMSELWQFANDIYPMLQALAKNRPLFGIVHGDVIPSNVLITANGALTLLDFDLFGLGWRTYDIACYLNEIDFWQMGETATAFLEGYSSVRPLSAEETRTLPLMRIARHIFSLYIAAANVNTWGSSIYLSVRVVDAAMNSLRALTAQLDSSR